MLRTLWVGSWGFTSCVGICALLLAWVFVLCFFRGYLCFASCVGICALLLAWVFALRFLRGYLRFARGFNVNDRQLAVNGRQCFVGIARNAR